MKAHISLTSGQTIIVDVERFATKRNGLGDFAGVEWTNKDGAGFRLMHVNVDKIAAVVIEREEGDE